MSGDTTPPPLEIWRGVECTVNRVVASPARDELDDHPFEYDGS